MNKYTAVVISIGILVLSSLGKSYLAIKEKEIDGQRDAQRYELFLNPNVGRFQYLLDKKTGKVWQATTYTDIKGQPTVWAYMSKIDNDDQLIELARLKEGL